MAAVISSRLIIVVLIIATELAHQTHAFYERPGVSARAIIEARGYLAEEHHLITPDGYRILITRATNPLILKGRSGLESRDPILFIHGILEDSAVFLINSLELDGPNDLSDRNLSDPGEVLRLTGEQSAKSLAFLALDFGHEVWLMNRRGSPGSRQKLGNKWSLRPRSKRQTSEQVASEFPLDPILSLPGALTNYGRLPGNFFFSFDRDFWGYSFDEQARWDLPLCVDYVRAHTNRSKVATVTHSAGGAILLMALASQPNLAEKLSNNVLWAPGFRLGFNDSFARLARARNFFENYGRSIPPAYTSNQLQGVLGVVCNIPLAPSTLCNFFSGYLTGNSAGKEPIRPQFLSTLFYPTASGELAQNAQNVVSGNIMHHYDYGKRTNRRYYDGQSEPPIYDLGQITEPVSLSFMTSRTDHIVSRQDVEAAVALLKGEHCPGQRN